MKNALIFDLDGTLWDATKRLTEIWNDVFAQYEGITLRLTPDRLRSLMGQTKEEIAANLFPERTEADRLDILNVCGLAQGAALRTTGGVLYDGVEETLAELHENYLLMIVSNCQTGYVQAFLDVCHLDAYFHDYEESGRTGKPKGENIQRIIERNHVRRAVYIGDTAGDQAAAAYAGIPFLFASYGFGSVHAPNGVLTCFRELPYCLDDVWNLCRFT